ncbi:hypothetical protein [Pleomorphomonas oryzae]|uniref:hypothetical protein n=1 Tax=Pleomorphomonas oryzae TaxID=261934 RepID=UPI00055A21AD|nr:hypothetical protein [Pleomorphomonas oryzae]
MKGACGGAAVLMAALWSIWAQSSQAASPAHEARERAEVRAIFQVLLAKIQPGDGWNYDLPCVFGEAWGRVGDDEKPPQPLLTVREALDPRNAHPEKFCDLAERNKTARAMAKKLAGAAKPYLNTADTTFTYPIFNRDLSRATVEREGGNDQWTPDGPGDFVASGTKIFLEKKGGHWRVRRMINQWIAN